MRKSNRYTQHPPKAFKEAYFIGDNMDSFDRFRFCLPFIVIILIGLLTFWVFEVNAQLEFPNSLSVAPDEDQGSAKSTNPNLERNLTTLFNEVDQSIVQISDPRATSFGSSQGSGFIYDRLGHIITNYQVVVDQYLYPYITENAKKVWDRKVDLDKLQRVAKYERQEQKID